MIFKPASLVWVTGVSPLCFVKSDFLLTFKRDGLGEKGTRRCPIIPGITPLVPDSCKRRANHERMFPRTDVRIDVRIGGASQEPENTADNDTLASGVGVQPRHSDAPQGRSRGTHSSPPVSALTGGLTMGWPGVMSVLPTFRANGSAGCLREFFPSMARAGVRAFNQPGVFTNRAHPNSTTILSSWGLRTAPSDRRNSPQCICRDAGPKPW